MAIARRMGYGKKIIVGDKKTENTQAIAKIVNEAGFDVVLMEMDLSSRESILKLIAEGQKYREITMLINAAGVSPSQSGQRMKQLTPQEDEQLVCTPVEELLSLDMLQPEKIENTFHAHFFGNRGTPLALDEFNGPRGDFYKNIFQKMLRGGCDRCRSHPPLF